MTTLLQQASSSSSPRSTSSGTVRQEDTDPGRPSPAGRRRGLARPLLGPPPPAPRSRGVRLRRRRGDGSGPRRRSRATSSRRPLRRRRRGGAPARRRGQGCRHPCRRTATRARRPGPHRRPAFAGFPRGAAASPAPRSRAYRSTAASSTGPRKPRGAGRARARPAQGGATSASPPCTRRRGAGPARSTATASPRCPATPQLRRSCRCPGRSRSTRRSPRRHPCPSSTARTNRATCRHRTPWPGSGSRSRSLLLRHIGLVLLRADGLTAAPDRLLTRLSGVAAAAALGLLRRLAGRLVGLVGRIAAPGGDEPLRLAHVLRLVGSVALPDQRNGLVPVALGVPGRRGGAPVATLALRARPARIVRLAATERLGRGAVLVPVPLLLRHIGLVLLRADGLTAAVDGLLGALARSTAAEPSPSDVTDCFCATSCDWSVEFA